MPISIRSDPDYPDTYCILLVVCVDKLGVSLLGVTLVFIKIKADKYNMFAVCASVYLSVLLSVYMSVRMSAIPHRSSVDRIQLVP